MTITIAPTGGKTYSNQTCIGLRYGLSAVAVGRLLTKAGLKTGDGVTPKAVACGYARKSLSANGIEYWIWEVEGVCKVVEAAILASPAQAIDRLAAQVQECLNEAGVLREAGNDFFAEMLEERSFDGIPAGLANVVRARLATSVQSELLLST